MSDIGEAARQRAVRALADVDKLATFAELVDIVVAALTEPHSALGAAAEALRKWNIAAPDGSMRFTINSADCTYVAITSVVLDAAAEHEAAAAAVEAHTTPMAPAVPWVPQVGDKVQWTRPAIVGVNRPEYGTVANSDNWLFARHTVIEPEDSPGNTILVPTADVAPDQRPQDTDELYERVQTLIKDARHTLLAISENPRVLNTGVACGSAKKLINALAALAELVGKPYTCHMRNCDNPIEVDYWRTLCSAHGRGNE